MRNIKINGCTFDSIFAEKFVSAWHRVTSKTRPHFISLTFNKWSLWERRIGKEVDYIIDLLYQAFIIKNDITKLLVDVDKRNSDDIVINIS